MDAAAAAAVVGLIMVVVMVIVVMVVVAVVHFFKHLLDISTPRRHHHGKGPLVRVVSTVLGLAGRVLLLPAWCVVGGWPGSRSPPQQPADCWAPTRPPKFAITHNTFPFFTGKRDESEAWREVNRSSKGKSSWG